MKRARIELFNFQAFDDKRYNRPGSKKDIKTLSSCIKAYVPQCNLAENPSSMTSKKLSMKLEKIAASDFSSVKYLLLFFSSHGDGRSILTSDMMDYPLAKIIDYFNCDALKDVPKIFVIQACRGEEYDEGHEVQAGSTAGIDSLTKDQCDTGGIEALTLFSSDPENPKLKVIETGRTCITNCMRALEAVMPTECLIAFSTPPDRYSWRSKSKGGYFIQALIAMIENFHRNKQQLDLVRLLLATNRCLATEFASRAEGAMGKRQIGEFVSNMTTRLLLTTNCVSVSEEA